MPQPAKKRKRVARGRVLNIRISDAEWASIADKAATSNLPVATFMRTAALGAEIRVPRIGTASAEFITELARLRTEFARIGNNLNQIARVVNRGDRLNESAIEVLRELQTTQASLRKMIDAMQDNFRLLETF